MTQAKATAQNVTLYPRQREIVERFAKENPAFNGNFSFALRFIIEDWWKHRQQNGTGKKKYRQPLTN